MTIKPSYKKIQAASIQLQEDLLMLDIESLDLPESVKSYFRFDLTKLTYVSQCNAYILYQLLHNHSNLDKSQAIIDHGAGIGLFSFLVKRMGYTCISHDIFEEYLDGIRKIGNALNAKPDYCILGDTNALVAYCNFHDINILGLASRNVIEHIPDYTQFFFEISQLGPTGFTMVITTSANIHNPLVKRLHHKIHRQYEYQGSRVDMDHPELNENQSGIRLRSEIIKKHFPLLEENTIKKLAELNRGFMIDEIISRTQYFIQTGNYPLPSIEASNTRDPITGAWVERLVKFSDYKLAANEAGFNMEAFPGFYNTNYNSKIKNIISFILNKFLQFNSKFILNLSPFLAMKLVKQK